jgi:hypothetical protein
MPIEQKANHESVARQTKAGMTRGNDIRHPTFDVRRGPQERVQTNGHHGTSENQLQTHMVELSRDDSVSF